MSTTSLRDIWEASVSQPYEPTIGKNRQLVVGFTLLVLAILLTGLFGLSMAHRNICDAGERGLIDVRRSLPQKRSTVWRTSISRIWVRVEQTYCIFAGEVVDFRVASARYT